LGFRFKVLFFDLYLFDQTNDSFSPFFLFSFSLSVSEPFCPAEVEGGLMVSVGLHTIKGGMRCVALFSFLSFFSSQRRFFFLLFYLSLSKL
jgi:hypothetical protein